jgi:hypothetical protein
MCSVKFTWTIDKSHVRFGSLAGHSGRSGRCPLYPRKRTFVSAISIVTADVGRFRLQKRLYVE